MNRASRYEYLANVIISRYIPVAVITFVVSTVCHHVTLTDAKIFERCELAQLLRQTYGVDLSAVANWVCIAQHSSSLNTSAFGGSAKSGSHGIFQISDEYWCSPPGKGVACGVSCDRLRDNDISDDFECVQKIYNEHQGLSGDGFNAWNAYQSYCKDNPYEYIADCFGNEEREYIRSKFLTTNYVQDEEDESYNQESRGKVYGRCELARELFLKHKMSMDEIPTWVCIAQHESNYDTSAVGRLNADGSADHGLFQISDLFWCSKKGGQRKACGVPCSQFIDSDITDDVKCIKQIHKEHTGISGDGFNAWTVYRAHCHGTSEKYIRGCFDGIDVDESGYSEKYRAGATELKGNTNKPHGKVYEACELADDLQNKYHLPEDQIATWVCIAKHESGYNTSAIGYGDHGLFQISDIYWCSPPGKGWACGLSCSDLEDSDITDDVTCIRKIYEEHTHLSGDGFNAWTVYPRYCSNGRSEKYISHCPGRSEILRAAASFNSYSKAINSNSIEEYKPSAKGKIYRRCELANELLDIHHIPIEEIPTWVCIAHHESNFDTSAIGRLNTDGSADHGLFQISDLFWCSHGNDRYGKACGLNCNKLLDSDISDDVKCIKQIHEEHTRISGDGFTAWTVYNAYCKDNVKQYIQGCFDGSASEEDFEHIHREIDIAYQPKNKPKGKVYEDCELATELRDKHRIPQDQISTWVCIAKHQSGLNTSASSADSHGMFFISDEFWCSPPGKGKACELHCSDLEDSDITDDVQCVKKIYEEHQRIFGNGFNAWRVYDQYCSNGRANGYISQCSGFGATFKNSLSYGGEENQYKFGGRSIDLNKPVFDHEFKENLFLKFVDKSESNAAGNLNTFSFKTDTTFKTTTPSWKNSFIQTTSTPFTNFNNFNSKSVKVSSPKKSYASSAPYLTMTEERAKYEFYMTMTTPVPPGFQATPSANRLQPYHLNTIQTFETTTKPFWLVTTSATNSWNTQKKVDATPFWLATTTSTTKPTSRYQFYESNTQKSATNPFWQSSNTQKPTSRVQTSSTLPFWVTSTTPKPTNRVNIVSTTGVVPFWLSSMTALPPTTNRFQANQPSTYSYTTRTTSTTRSPYSSKTISLPLPTLQTTQIKTSTRSSTTKIPTNLKSVSSGQYNSGQYNSGKYNAGQYEAPKNAQTTLKTNPKTTTIAATKPPSTVRITTSTTKSPWSSKQVSSTTSKTTKYDPFRQFTPTTTKSKTTTIAYAKKPEPIKSVNSGLYVPYKTSTTVRNPSPKTATTNNWNSWSTSKTTPLPFPSSSFNNYPTATSTKTTLKPYSFSTTIKPTLRTTTKPTQKFSFQFTTPPIKVATTTSRSISNLTTQRSNYVSTKTPTTTVSNFTKNRTTIKSTPTSKNNVYDLYFKLYGIQPPSGK